MPKKLSKSVVIICSITATLTFFIVNRFTQLFQIAEGGTDILSLPSAISFAFTDFFNAEVGSFVSFRGDIMFISLTCVLVVLMLFTYYIFTPSKMMRGKEHGTARWGTEKDIRPFIDFENPDNNIILSATEKLSLSPRMPNPLHNRNKNVVCIGGSGKGKSRFVAKPNLCQLNTSFVVTDPKGELFAECGDMLATNGYKIKVLNLEEMDRSDKFNFFSYIHNEKDILIVVDNILANTTSDEAKSHSGDDFWVKSERALLTALIAFIKMMCIPKERNINSILLLMDMASAREDNEDYISPLDVLFLDLKEKHPTCLACYMYNTFKLASGKTAKSILVSLGVRLAPFAIDEVRELMSDDELDLEGLGREKTALFLIVPETYTTFNFIVCILYQLMLERLYELAKHQPNRRCPVPIQIIGDEIANIGQIPNLHRYISTMRSYGISIILIYQTYTQLESTDKVNYKTIIGNCDSFIFLGGKEQSTNEYVSKSIGKMTIDNRQINETRGVNGSSGRQDSTLGRDLLDPAEVEKIPGDECIVMLSGVQPFKSKKYPLEQHPRYNLLADGGAPLFSFEKRNTDYISEQFKGVDTVISIELPNEI